MVDVDFNINSNYITYKWNKCFNYKKNMIRLHKENYNPMLLQETSKIKRYRNLEKKKKDPINANQRKTDRARLISEKLDY